MAIASTATDPKICHVADLVQLGFYFCLVYCEYKNYTGHLRTVHFQTLLDFLFLFWDLLLTDDVPINYFQHVTHIVLTLDNKKNSVSEESVSHFRYDYAAAFPVRDGVNIFLTMW